jgi:SAM-dependent methyltransferase
VSDPSWSEGYVVDLDYTSGYFRELSPAYLRFVALLGGVEVQDAASYTYYELGCGNGYSTTLHAAANPEARFYGVDFNPTHIHNAQRLAQDARAANVRFLEKSFGELLDTDLADADFIALHGVWSWVGDEQRRHLLEFIRRRLKPGGLVYVSYNCLPGIAQVAPLQRLINEHAAAAAGDRLDKVRRSIDFASRLQQAGARFFFVNPLAASRLAALRTQDPHYVAHEYHNANWTPFYHADVARDLAGAKLSYAGCAALIENFDQLTLSPELARLAAELGERSLAETMKDFARNQVFRRDVFTRGAPKAAPARLDAMLDATRFCLARPRASCRMKTTTLAGELALQPESYAPVLDALARAPMTFTELSQAPECAQLDRIRLRQAVFGMAALGNLLPALPVTGEDARVEAAGHFNQAALRTPLGGTADFGVASPVLGAGIQVNLVDRLLLAAPRDEAQAIAAALRVLGTGKIKLRKEKKELDSPADLEAYVRERAQFFFKDFLPFLRLLRVAT